MTGGYGGRRRSTVERDETVLTVRFRTCWRGGQLRYLGAASEGCITYEALRLAIC
jgi:hypothetical protein